MVERFHTRQEWRNTSHEALGKRKKKGHNKRGLKVWNHGLKMAIKEKQRAYNRLLTSRTPESDTRKTGIK